VRPVHLLEEIRYFSNVPVVYKAHVVIVGFGTAEVCRLPKHSSVNNTYKTGAILTTIVLSALPVAMDLVEMDAKLL